MSAISCEIIAAVLREHVGARRSSAKLLIQSARHLPPIEEIYAALRSTATCEIAVKDLDGGTDHLLVGDFVSDDVILIPFLVRPSHAVDAGDPNNGTQGWNGTLRDSFDRETSEVRVLVTFDETPIETALTSMEHGLDESLLSSDALLDALRDFHETRVAPGVRQIVRGVVKDLVSSGVPLDARELDAIHSTFGAMETAVSAGEAGQGLGQLPWYFSDEDVADDVAGRLADSRYRRGDLERLAASPSANLSAEIRERFTEDVVPEILSRMSLNGFRTDGLDLELLRGSENTAPSVGPLRFAVEALQFPGFGEPVLKQATAKDLRAAMVVRAGTIALRVALQKPLKESEALHLHRWDGEGEGLTRVDVVAPRYAGSDAAVEVLEIDLGINGAGWHFFSVALSRTKSFKSKPAAEIKLALRVVDEGPLDLIYEEELEIDAEHRAFVVGETVHVSCLSENGHGVKVVELNPPDEQDMAVSLETPFGDLPVLPRSIQLPSPTMRPEADTSMHLALELLGRDELGDTEVVTRASSDAVVFDLGTERRFATDVPELPDGARWAVERWLIEHPKETAVAREGGDLGPLTSISTLNMVGLEPAWSTLQNARAAFFDALSMAGKTSIALMAADDEMAARAYVEAYAALLMSIEPGDQWRAEYGAALLLDAVHDRDSGALLVAPTHPLHVLATLELGEKLGSWRRERGANLHDRDHEAFRLTSLIPLIRFGDAWYESAPAPWGWRRYVVAGEDADLDRRSLSMGRYVQQRIESFLAVHPGYRDRRRELTLGFVNPGTAGHVLSGLQALIDSHSERLDCVPSFRIILLADSELRSLGTALDRFTTTVQEVGADRWQAIELARRLKFTKRSLRSWLAEERSFAHVTFVERLVDRSTRAEYEPAKRPRTTFVGGLATAVGRSASVHKNEVTFTTGVWRGPRGGLGLSQLEDLLERSNALVRVADNLEHDLGRARGFRITVKLDELDRVYLHSGWVVHLDRHVGVELFRLEGARSRFILDYSDQGGLGDGDFDAVTATSNLDPYVSLIKDALEPVEAALGTREAALRTLGLLNVLSGRWAMSLIGSDLAAVKGRLGTVLAYHALHRSRRLFEDLPGVLRIVVGLDELLRIDSGTGDRMDEGWARRFGRGLVTTASDDLLLLEIPVGSATGSAVELRGRVIEVKYRENGVGSLDSAAQQVRATHRLLSQVLGSPAEPGHLLRGRDLAALITSHLKRLESFRYIDESFLETPQLVATIDRISSGNFSFISGEEVAGETFAGDVITVEPDHQGAMTYLGAVSVVDGLSVGRWRVGRDDFASFAHANDQPAAWPPPIEGGEGGSQNGDSDLAILGSRVQMPEPPTGPTPRETNAQDDEAAPSARPSVGPSSGAVNQPGEEAASQAPPEVGVISRGGAQRPKALLGSVVDSFGIPSPAYFDPESPARPLPNGHVAISGETGSGKTQAIKGVLRDLLSAGLPVLVLDFKDDYSQAEYSHAEGFNVIDVANGGLTFNPLAIAGEIPSRDLNPTGHIFQLAEIFKRVYGLGPQQTYQLREAMKSTYAAHGVGGGDAPATWPPFGATREHLADQEALLGRLSPVFDLELFPAAGGDGELQKMLSQRTVVRLSRLPGDEIKNAVAEILLLSLYSWMIGQEQPHRLTRVLVLDEAWRIVDSPFLEPLMREGRSMGLGIVVASQYPGDFNDVVAGATATRIFFGQSDADAVRGVQKSLTGRVSGPEADSVGAMVKKLPTFACLISNRQFEPFQQVQMTPYFQREDGDGE